MQKNSLTALDELESNLAWEKQELLELLLAEQGFDPKAQTREVIERVGASRAPLSSAQKRLWLLHELAPRSAAYNLTSAFRARGHLDLVALENALQQIVRRHEILRTTFHSDADGPVQVIHPTMAAAFSAETLADAPPEKRAEAISRMVTDETERPFDLSQGSALRMHVVRLGVADSLLLISAHHLVYDGFSIGIFVRELAELYQAGLENRPPRLASRDLHYADFAHWQQRQDYSEQLAYWKRQLAGLPKLQLPTDRIHPPVQTFHGACRTVAVPAELTERLRRIGQQQGATLFMTLLAAFQALLQRYSGQDDFAVGVAVANRDRSEIEELIGFFVNTLVIRADASGDPTFRELLARTRATVTDGFTHQHAPFEQVVEVLQPERSLSHLPLVQVMFVLQNAPMGRLKLPGLSLEPLKTDRRTAKFDLTLALEVTQNGLEGEVEYNTDVFDEATAARMLKHFCQLLEGIAANPARRLSELPLLTDAERSQLLTDWSGTTTAYPRDKCIHELFEEQARRHPDRIAVVFGQQRLTYRELNERANQLGHYLRSLGVELETPVALVVERSVEMVVALLGILKAGGAYVPLDPDDPAERLAWLLEEIAPAVVLTQAQLAQRPAASGAKVLRLDSDWPAVGGQSREELEVAVPPESLAYVLFTSGSTGTPKGVSVGHRSVVRLVKETDYADLGADQVYLQLAPLQFDASTLEIWAPLLNGGCLVVAPPQTASLDEIGDYIRRYRVTTLWLTAGLFHLMVDERLDDLKPLRQLLVGGDVLSVSHVFRALGELNGCRLINGYGPTENTTFTCCHQIEAADRLRPSIPIGRPIANTRVYILDRYLQPTPIGVAGELCIGGDGLARGYHNRADLTKAQFIDNPFAGDGDSRVYKTGDLCRWLPDGIIEFLGRRDQQVKIRGFRVELGEIESALVSHAAVREAVVTSRKESTGKHLVAYVTPASTPRPVVEELRSYLDAKLPAYMIPAYFVVLDKLPLNVNGKVDRAKLPEPEMEPAARVPPRTATEHKLANIFADVLHVGQVGADSNFFDLGGHSLLATQLISRLREAFCGEVPMRFIFQSPTVAGLAAQIDKLGGAAYPPAIVPAARDDALPLSFAQERLWFLDQLELGNPFYNVPIALRLTGELNVEALKRSVNEVVSRHQVLRTTLPERDGKPAQCIAPTLDVPLQDTDLSGLPLDERAAEVERRVVAESLEPFDLARGPLIRTGLLRLGAREHVLMFTIHHIVADGWSMGILIHEVESVYSALCRGEPSPLAELTIQYADFAIWQREWLRGDELDRQLSWWKDQLVDCPPVLELPTDRPRPPNQSHRGSSVKFIVAANLTTELRRLSRRADATLFMTLLSAWATLLYRYSGRDDLVIGSPIANRNRREIEPLIGFFVNTLPMRIDLSDTPTYADLLQRVRHFALDAYAHQDLPFERLIDELDPERDLSLNPLFQVMFALQNSPVSKLALPDLEVEIFETQRRAALFDLVLDMWETGDTLTGVLEFNTDLFDQATVERMAESFQTLLHAIAVDPQRRVDELPLLTATQQQRLLALGDGPRAACPVGSTIGELFERQAAESGDRIAAVHNERQITFAELNAQANQIAHRLKRLGVKRHEFVGILEQRGIDFLASMLGILKAGGAFLPIDPAYPTGRIRHMLDDSGVRTLVGRRSIAAAALLGSAALMDLDSDELADEPTGSVSPIGSPDDVAYMLYTSGSTGLPKGALVRHNGAVNHIFAEFDLLKFHRDSKFLQSAPSSSDISVWQFLAPLLIGGRTVVADYETVCDPRLLWATIKSQRITLIELVPVVMKELLEYVHTLPASERWLPDLEWAMVTGEAAPVSLVNQWLTTWPHIPLVNAYGPTEVADDVAQHVLAQPLPTQSRNVPIGRPLPNLTLYVLDPHLRLVPLGVPGEICVSGIGVGAGYWNDEAKTRECFVANPHADGYRGDVLYRTGDLGRWLPDGTLECLNRLDQQVKIRGFRIELGEIEGVLSGHPAVRDAAVLVREDRPGDNRLVAYFLPNENSEAVEKHLRRLQKDQIGLWQKLHEDSYRETLDYDDPTFNVIGWDSNYTGQPLPREDMREYVDFTVGRIRALGPRRVLEIGSGTGLIMFPLLPHVEAFVGTDLSAVAIRRLQQLLDSSALRERVPGLDKARLLHRRADDLEWAKPHSFDTVILPSVVQYFPGLDYLELVLKSLIDRVIEPGGAIFLGDVRSLPLLKAFHASVQLYKSDDGLPVGELAQRVQSQLAREQELAIDPEFFLALADQLPRIQHVEILPKRGRRMNEMTRFRYDVIIRLANETSDARNEQQSGMPRRVWNDWREHQPSVAEIRRTLTEEQPAVLAYRHVANNRVTAALQTLDWLFNAHDPPHAPEFGSADQLKAAQQAAETGGLEPEDFWELAADLPYHVDVSLASARHDGSFDVVLTHCSAGPPTRTSSGESFAPTRRKHANNPLREKLARGLASELREFLKAKVPNYMVPSDFVMLDELPLTPAGKIDRKSLPPPDTSSKVDDAYVAPRTATEEIMCRIWADVLGVDRVGVGDNFFALGGHSLKATQVVSRIHRELSFDIPLREIFSHPTVAELAGQVRGRHRSKHIEIPRLPDAAHYELSHAQRRLWVLSQMEDGLAAYNMPAALLLAGHVDIAALQTAVDALVQRHESLRTSFVVVDGKPRQKIWPRIEVPIRQLDLSDSADPELRARELALTDGDQPFDLGQGGLLRVSLLKIGADRFVLLFNIHHIISDDWSLNVLVREFTDLYRDGSNQLPLRIQYRDYASWQNDYLESEQSKTHRDYWHEKLAGEIPVLDLPTDYPRPPVKTYHGRTLAFYFDPQLTTELESISRQRGASLFMTLVAAVKALLYRYSGQQDLIVGFPIAGREHTDLEPQIGFFVNVLPLRTQVRDGMSFAELLELVKSGCTEAYEHQMYPFDVLVDELNLPRDVSRNPLFDVVVVMQSEQPGELTLGDASVSNFLESYEGSKFDLHFTFDQRDDRLEASIVYNTDLFQAARIERMCQHLTQLIRSVVHDAAQPIQRISFLTPDEQQRLLEFNPQCPSFDCPQTLVEMFESQVARTPGAVAVVWPGEGRLAYTYAELNIRANQLAYHLLGLGVRPNDLVGLCLDRSLDTVVSILGVLKAGAAYLPFDTAHPIERLRFMLADTGADVLVTSQDLADRLPNPPRHVVHLDSQAELISRQPTDNPPRQAQPADLAYVIYTSGSTGRPKGVPVSHENVARLFAATEHWFHFHARDVWTLFHSYAFDFSVWELWGALLHGGRLIVLPYSVARSPEAFYEMLSDEHVTVLNQTPSAFRQLVQLEDRLDECRKLDLRLVIFGGEALDLPSLQPWFARHGDDRPQLVNMYGITETTVHVTYREIKSDDVHETASLIGKPIPDLRIHLLDGQRSPVPIGVAGEIYVGGAGVTKGYLNRPELTSQRFTADPFNHEPGAMLYRSGDLARYREDGDIEFLGRLDDQVQIRGFRVELGEIAAALMDHPSVRDAVVIAQEFAGGIRLVAYYVPGSQPAADHATQTHAADASTLRPHLRERLPDYMIPAAFIPLDGFPLTPNGKLDRKALPQPGDERTGVAAPFIAPRNDVEETVSAVFRQVLELDQVGIDDNFFDLGAHSLLLVEANNRVRAALQRDIPIVWMFQYPTVRSLAEQLAQREEKTATFLDKARQRASQQLQARRKRGR